MIHPPPLVSRRALLRAGALAVPVGALAACGDGEGEPRQGPSGPLEPVTYLPSFRELGRDGYAHYARELGLFTDAGFDVTIQPNAGAVPAIAGLLSGRAQYAVADMAATAIAYGSEYQGDDEEIREELAGSRLEGVVYLAAIHQRQPLAIMTYEGSGVETVYDLPGHSVGLPPGATGSLLFPAYLDAAGVPLDEVERVDLAAEGLIPALVSGQVDAISQFIMGRPLVENASVGRSLVVLPVDEFLSDLYGVGLMTTRANAESNPDGCARFRDALLAGLDASLNNPTAAAEALEAAVIGTEVAVAAAELEAMADYSRPTLPGLPLGHIEHARLARHIATLTAAGLRTTPLGPEELVDFTLVPGVEAEE